MKIMAFLFTLLMSLNAYCAQAPYIVSGFDDVLRQANNTSLFNAAKKILEADRSFSGMPELYQVISKNETAPQFSLISAISSWFDSRVEKILVDEKFPSHKLYLRNWITEPSIEKFKLEKLTEVLKEHPGRSFIVIFDNSDPSIEMAQTIHDRYPKEVVAVYLHQVIEKKLPETATAYYTAFDIALSEFKAGRLSIEDLRSVGAAVVRTKDIESLFPSYAVTPKEFNKCDDLGTEAKMICSSVADHLKSLISQKSR